MVVFKPSLSKIAQHQKSLGKRHNTFLEGSDQAEVLQKHEEMTRAALKVFWQKTADKTTLTVYLRLVSLVTQFILLLFLVFFMRLGVDSNHIHPCLRPLNLWSCSASRNTNAVITTRLYRTHTASQLAPRHLCHHFLRQWPLGGVRGQHHYQHIQMIFLYLCIFFNLYFFYHSVTWQ